VKGLSFFLLAAIFVGALIWMATLKRPQKIAARGAAAVPAAEMVLLDGKILTVDPHDSVAEAMAIGPDGRIVAVGTSAEIHARIGADTKVIDLHGRTATPGLIDSHGHYADGGINELYTVNLSEATSIAEIEQKVAERAKTLKPGEWIQGTGWDESKLTELRYVHAADLDKVAPKNPVWLLHTTGHYGVANSFALKLAHIARGTKNPKAGTIDRDAQGNPSGVLKENAMLAVTSLIPPVTPDQEHNAILHIIDALHAEGMTAIKEGDIQPHTWDAYKRVLDENKLKVRVFTLWDVGTTMDAGRATLARIKALPLPPRSLGEGLLLSGGGKLYMDGSGGGRTAWLYDDWHVKSTEIDKGNKGYPAIDVETYKQLVRLYHQAGIHVGTHAIGDRAIDTVVDTYAEVLKETPTHGLRHSIIHSNIPTDHALETMAMLEKQYDAGYPELQAPFMWWIGDTYAGTFGPQRAARLLPLKTMVARGIVWGGGSDYFVTPFAARYGIWASVARETLKGVYGAHPFGTAEAVDARVALRSYTEWAAHQLFLDGEVGSIEPGKDADIAIWDRDMYTAPTPDLKNLKCEMTLFKGEIVFKADATPVTVTDPKAPNPAATPAPANSSAASDKR
jgi:predicted amidohydrolase YtcJ